MIDLNEKPLCTIPRVMCWAVDNLELLKSQPDESVDLIYCDILYGTGNPQLLIHGVMGSNYCSVGAVRDFRVLLCDRKEIVGFVEHWHYSKNVNGLTTDYCFKLLDTDGNMIGAMIYGKIAMANVWKKYAEKETDLIELKRLCCIDNTPKNTESFFIGHTLRWLKKNTDIKTVISYADMTYSHEGTIYKASNFLHNGMTAKGKVIMYNGKRYHDKTIRTKYKGELKPFAVEIKKALGNGGAEYVDTLGKHIYLYQLRCG